VSPQCLRPMADSLAHRGPDDRGYAVGDTALHAIDEHRLDGVAPCSVGFAHRRLSILDLSPGGHQPQSTADGSCSITYNGEIYNYLELRGELKRFGWTFSTSSDTEVILVAYQQWGTRCVTHFNGIFAFAIWDGRRRELFCARDHLGVKPFLYAVVGEAFYFASDTRAFLRGVDHDWQLNRDAVLEYCHAMYTTYPRSMVDGIQKLGPGSTLTVSADLTVSEAVYWRVSDFGNHPLLPDTSTAFHELLDDVIRLQMRSDVKVGTFLSGGVDSSAIVALLHRNGVAPIDTFSVGYEGHSIDERPFARQVAERAGARQHELVVSPEMVGKEAPRALSQMGEPIADSAFLPTLLLSEMASGEGIKVVLNGTGGDEVFGGYHRHLPDRPLRRVFNAIPDGWRPALGRLLPQSILALRLRHPSIDMIGGIGGDLGFLADYFLEPQELAEYCARVDAELSPALRAVPPDRPGYRAMYFDLRYYLVEDLLMLLDNMGMAASIEGRVPFLDVRLVEFLYRLPERTHFEAGLKTFARRQFTDLLPQEILNRRKMGFGGPVPFWVRSLRGQLNEFFSSGESVLASFSRDAPRFSAALLAPEASSRGVWRVFRAYVFEVWYRMFQQARSDRLSGHCRK